MMKKSCRALTLCLLSAFIINNSHADTPDLTKDPQGQGGAMLVLGAGSLFFHNGLSKALKKVTKVFNVDSADFISLLGMASICKGVSLCMPDEWGFIKTSLGTIPLALILAKVVTTTQLYNKILGKIPVIGNHLTCHNEECEGMCNKCKLKKHLIAIIVANAIKESGLVDTITGYATGLFSGNQNNQNNNPPHGPPVGGVGPIGGQPLPPPVVPLIPPIAPQQVPVAPPVPMVPQVPVIPLVPAQP